MLSAVIFDLDGLMVDSTPLQQQASRKFLESFGKLHYSNRSGREGMRIIDIISEYKDIYNLPGSLEELYHKRQQIYFEIAKEQLELFPDLLPLLEKLQQKKLKLAIATSGDRDYIELLFKKFPQLLKFLPVVTTSEDVQRGKPYPDVYLKTAEKLGVVPNSCIVLEDSMTGVAAAKAANMQVICIPNKHYPEADYSQADRSFNSLGEVIAAIP